MANNFLQETVSREVLLAQRNNSIVRQFCTTEYEGEIYGLGTSVRINTLVPPVLYDTQTSALNRDPDKLDSTTLLLQIERDKNYKFVINHQDVAQGMPTRMFEKSLFDIGRQIARDADKLVLSKYVDITDIAHVIPKATIDMTTIYNFLIDVDVKMTELEIPVSGRLIVLPPRIAGLLAKDSVVRLKYDSADDNLVNGYVTTVGNLTIVQSVDVPVKTKDDGKGNQVPDSFECLAFVAGMTFAHVTGFAENKVVESQYNSNAFADIAMGQICSGAKCIMPQYCVLAEIAYI
jgi:hypothetical protein